MFKTEPFYLDLHVIQSELKIESIAQNADPSVN